MSGFEFVFELIFATFRSFTGSNAVVFSRDRDMPTSTPPTCDYCHDRDRGQANVLGNVLVIGMVITSALSLVGLGIAGLMAGESAVVEEETEGRVLDVRSDSLAALADTSENQLLSVTQLPAASTRLTADAGTLLVSITDTETNPNSTAVVLDTSLNAAVVNRSGTSWWVESGGVWRETGDRNGEAARLAPPTISASGDTLRLQAITMETDTQTANGSLGKTTTIQNTSITRVYPVQDDLSRSNPVETSEEIEIMYSGPLYAEWALFFSSEVDSLQRNTTVTVDVETATTTVTVEAASAGEPLYLHIQRSTIEFIED
jgi:hypothetical protein